METEHFIECCEWCGRDTAFWGRFLLRNGPGFKMVLCAVCAEGVGFELRYGEERGCELVTDVYAVRR